MHQDDINKDLDHYIHEKKKKPAFWKRFRPKHEVQQDIKKDLEEADLREDLSQEDKKDLEEMEHKIEEVNQVEEKVEEEINEEREGLLTRFFKRLRSNEPKEEEFVQAHEESDDEMKEFLKVMHSWITKLDPDVQKEFKGSKDFELYTSMLKKHGLIK